MPVVCSCVVGLLCNVCYRYPIVEGWCGTDDVFFSSLRWTVITVWLLHFRPVLLFYCCVTVFCCCPVSPLHLPILLYCSCVTVLTMLLCCYRYVRRYVDEVSTVTKLENRDLSRRGRGTHGDDYTTGKVFNLVRRPPPNPKNRDFATVYEVSLVDTFPTIFGPTLCLCPTPVPVPLVSPCLDCRGSVDVCVRVSPWCTVFVRGARRVSLK